MPSLDLLPFQLSWHDHSTETGFTYINSKIYPECSTDCGIVLPHIVQMIATVTWNLVNVIPCTENKIFLILKTLHLCSLGSHRSYCWYRLRTRHTKDIYVAWLTMKSSWVGENWVFECGKSHNRNSPLTRGWKNCCVVNIQQYRTNLWTGNLESNPDLRDIVSKNISKFCLKDRFTCILSVCSDFHIIVEMEYCGDHRSGSK